MLIISEEQEKILRDAFNLKINFSTIEKVPILDYDYKTDDDVIVGYNHYKPFTITDDLNGRCLGKIDVDSNLAIITWITSGSDEHGDDIKPRGFFTNVIRLLKQNNVTHIRVSLQSAHSRIALSKLLQKQILKNPTDLRGISVDLHPTKFEIS